MASLWGKTIGGEIEHSFAPFKRRFKTENKFSISNPEIKNVLCIINLTV